MEQSLSQSPVFEIEHILQRAPYLDDPDSERFAMVPGTLSLFLERGYALGRPGKQLRVESRIDLDRYGVMLVPAEFGQNHAGLDSVVTLTWKELLAHVLMGLEESTAPRRAASNIVEFGDVRVDLLSHEVRRSDHLLRLSAMEFKVLKFFLINPNRVISRDEFLNEVWGYNNYPCTRTVDNHILRLRHKIEPDIANPIFFRTEPRFGYRFTPLGNTRSEAGAVSRRLL